MEQGRPGMLKPAIVSGAILGALSGLPGFDLFNCCTCCSLAVGAGFLASYLYSRESIRRGASFVRQRRRGSAAHELPERVNFCRSFQGAVAF